MVSIAQIHRRMILATAAIPLGLPLVQRQTTTPPESTFPPQAGTTPSTTTAFHTVTPENAESSWFLGHAARIYGDSERTGGAFDLVDFDLPPGFATPLHVHHTADEVFWVLEGTVRGLCAGKEWRASPGDMVWLPRGLPHGFATVGDTPGRHLTMTMPGGFDAFVREAGEPMGDPDGTPPPIPDPSTLAALAEKHGQTILGGPLSFED